jgi:hypothetical protein
MRKNEIEGSPESRFLSIPSSLKHRLFQEEDSADSNQIMDCSLQLSKSSMSQENQLYKSRLLTPKASKSQESPANSMKTLSEMSFNQSPNGDEIPTETWRMSEAITSAKNSFCEQEKDDKFSINYTSFAVPSRIYCKDCEKEVFTIVITQFIQPGFWENFEKFINSFVCCENKDDRKERQLVHCCSRCHKILAKISAGV